MQLKSNDNGKENSNNIGINSVNDIDMTDNNDDNRFKSVFENFFRQITDLNSLTTFGPFTSLINDPNTNIKTLTEHGNLLIKYQSFLNLYLSRMINAYFLALNKVSSLVDEKKPEDVRKIIINTFEDVYSAMLESSEFSISYNNLLNSIIDINKSYQKFFDSNQIAFRQQMSKEEKDSLFYNLYEIKKLSLEIKKKLNEKKNE
ncbi:MAG TPA: hypothetical protein VEQ18_05585 [Candidatus Nitrosocosmicus sp.]|nr:hypothetical protein [Candidatus Nitrosocosmicus sp.]